MQYVFFTLIFFYVANWRLVHTWFKKDASRANVAAKKSTNKTIADFIYKKTHVKLEHVYIAPSKGLFAFCGGITRKPILVISQGAYDTFTGDALEWLLLHEIGHHVLDHMLGITTVQLSYAIVGGFILLHVNTIPLLIFFVPVLGVLLAIASIQTNKIFDIYANTFAVKKMDNPLGMKEGALLFMQQAKDNGQTHDTILMKLFYPWNYALWRRTIRDAEKEAKQKENASQYT